MLEKSIPRSINICRLIILRTLIAGMTTTEQYREQHCTYHLILFAASVSCAAEIYRRSYPRKLYKYCRGDISVVPYASPRPLDIQMSAGISELWQRFSATKYYLPPHRRAPPSPSRRRPSSIRKKEEIQGELLSRRGSISPSRISLFRRGLTIQ